MIVLETVLGLALLKALSILLPFTTIDFYKLLGYDIWVDLLLGTTLLYMYQGSAHGVLIATMAGSIVSVVLRLVRWAFGYKRWSWARRRWEYYP
jgi:hypothetical protein